jgi:hypothetical protein
MVFVPHFKLDLATASQQSFAKLLEDFEAWRATEPQRPLHFTNGWVTVDQEAAEGLLLRNPTGGNRKPALPTIKYYARQMIAGTWIATGQAILINKEGKLEDAGHRLWASYLSGASFPSYIITDVPVNPTLFAYIDAGKGRSAADALATAGLNGVAKHMATVVSMALQYEHGCFTPTTKKPMDKMSPMEFVTYVQQHENLKTATRLMNGEYKAAASVLAHKDVAGFTAYQILDLHGEDVLDDFMNDLAAVADDPTEGDPIEALRKVLDDDARSVESMKKHQVLGHVIKAFNHWLRDEKVKRIQLRVNEAFPHFATAATPQRQAAE